MSFWDNIACFYDAAEWLNRKVYRTMLTGVRTLVPFGADVLDCAAGTGQLTLAAAEKASHVMCTDLSLPMLEQARKKCRRNNVKNVSFGERDITALSDADESYDVVMAGNVLHLLDCPEKALSELYRVTRKGGRLILPTFLTVGKAPMLISLYKLIGFRPSASYTPESYFEMLRNCGLGRVKMKIIRGKVPCGFAVIEKR